MGSVRKRIYYQGSVQGVGFRFTTHRMANRHRLTGYVRNLPDGTVEMLAQGRPGDIDDCIRDVKESFTGYLRETRIQEIPAACIANNTRCLSICFHLHHQTAQEISQSRAHYL